MHSYLGQDVYKENSMIIGGLELLKRMSFVQLTLRMRDTQTAQVMFNGIVVYWSTLQRNFS